MPRFMYIGDGAVPAINYFDFDFAKRPWAGASTYPTALYHSGSDKTYFAYEALMPMPVTKVGAFNHATGLLEGPWVIGYSDIADDDHLTPALEILSDGRLVCFWGAHVTDMKWSISAQSGGVPTLNSWTAQTALTGSYSYPHPVNIDSGGGAGTLYLFVRERDGASPVQDKLKYKTASYTSGGAVTFSADINAVDFDDGGGGRVYMGEVRKDGSDNIEIIATRAEDDDSTRQHVYYFKLITSTAAWENLDGGTSTASGSLPINLTLANSDYREITSSGSNIVGNVSWCRDTNGYLHVLYGDDTTDPWNVSHQYYNGSVWSSATTAFTVDRKGTAGFVEIWAAVPLTSGTIAAYYPSGTNGSFTGRGNDDISRSIWNGSTWGGPRIVSQGDEVTAWGHPVSVRDADPDMRVLITQVKQDELDDPSAVLRRAGIGDSGSTNWGSLTDTNFQKTCLLLNFNGTDAATSTADASPWKVLHPVTFFGNAQLDTAQKKFGSASLLLDGTGDYIKVVQAALTSALPAEFKLFPGDTLEGFIRRNDTGRLQTIWSTRPTGTSNGFNFQINTDNTLITVGYSAGSVIWNISSTSTLTTGVWYYVGLKRNLSSGDIELWLDGTMENSVATVSPVEGDSFLWIGRDQTNTARDFRGWIDSVRFTKKADRDLSVVPSSEFAEG